MRASCPDMLDALTGAITFVNDERIKYYNRYDAPIQLVLDS